MSIKHGVYQHHKGKKYLVLGIVKHSETLEDLVLYIPLYESDTSQLWVRPVGMFTEVIEKEGKSFPRFTFLHE